MPAYHQMGNDSSNLLGAVSGFGGAIISPVNENETDVEDMVATHGSSTFEFVFDPQLYFPRRGDRGQLAGWSYFPKEDDFDSADLASTAWWATTCAAIVKTALDMGAPVVCSPSTISAATYSNDYYAAMREPTSSSRSRRAAFESFKR